MESDNTGKLEKTLVNILTTNHTFFMRSQSILIIWKQVVLPYLKQKNPSIEIYVYGVQHSTGEEPYTLAMVMLDFFGLEQSKWDTKVLATDISTNVLKQACMENTKQMQLKHCRNTGREGFSSDFGNRTLQGDE